MLWGYKTQKPWIATLKVLIEMIQVKINLRLLGHIKNNTYFLNHLFIEVSGKTKKQMEVSRR